ncbi:hypothetical protein D9M71_571640 [compost metagenome]
MAVISLHVAGFFTVLAGLAVELGQGCTTLEFFQVIEDCLLDQPVWSTVDGLGCGLQSLTGRVVKFDPKGGRRQFLILIIATCCGISWRPD